MISEERIMGFVEGEGCFSIAIQRHIDRTPRKCGWKYNIKRPFLFEVMPSFRLTICEADRQILEEVRETLGIGQIYVQKRSLEGKGEQNIAHYYAEGLKQCLLVREFFQKQKFYTRKGKNFQLWCKCLEIVESGRHLEKEGLLEICGIRDQMNYRSTKRKWGAEEIEKILDAKPIHQTAHFNEKQENSIHNENMALKEWLRPRQGNSMKGKPILDLAEKT